ncbi:Uncharacterised protein [Vibrio cholerae]|nr:Uncharacterised protein [Vibrio cholerae]
MICPLLSEISQVKPERKIHFHYFSDIRLNSNSVTVLWLRDSFFDFTD